MKKHLSVNNYFLKTIEFVWVIFPSNFALFDKASQILAKSNLLGSWEYGGR